MQTAAGETCRRLFLNEITGTTLHSTELDYDANVERINRWQFFFGRID
jgi:hypothetical protein